MTTLIMQATPFVELVATTLRTVYLRFLGALDAFVDARVRNAVPESELRRVQREIERYQRLMHAEHKSLAKKVQTRR